MAELRLKNSDMVHVITKDEALQLRTVIEDPTIPNNHYITIHSISFEKGAVRSLNVESTPQLGNNENWKDKIIEWEFEWRKIAALSPEAKADRMKSIFNSWWFAYTGEDEAPADLWDRAYKLALMYFMKYPSMTICDPIMWRHLFPEDAARVPLNVHTMSYPIRKAIIRILTQRIGQDVSMSQRFGHMFKN